MGLCKCPNRKVTNLFCFQHHVNVCEQCLASQHSQCIVRSYVQWLQDNDFNPNCLLCNNLLTENGETVRLICYDIFHWSCLNQYFQKLPLNTAPDGYQCPQCKQCIFPQANLVSPIADQLRQKLATVTWARAGLGLPLVEDNRSQRQSPQQLTETEKNGYVIVSQQQQQNQSSSSVSLPVEQQGLSYHTKGKSYSSDTETMLSSTLNLVQDVDDDKYKRRSIFSWFARYLRSRQVSGTKRKPMSRLRWTCYLIIVCLFVFVTIFTILHSLTRSSDDDNDPQFDPLNNPMIRVGNRFIQKLKNKSFGSVNNQQQQDE
ncbi:unnamed protein product [Didymodactylos carnosus]|uniref:RING-type domain-containing protein n=1 Tax=Didymodactylos carnosus TaxID=1234261 RepID=A0A814VK49_9BILA|nr:unnamed protein product [Didymodactylos carnosus]CAF1203352.1 unnamed protein product [Didymodactylos carnosus]CAF3954318.1 unnamed protein product [Didymodactylos carnosus]CAF4013049.1 unnamed protein product [Didymodactylos carnosus]